MSQSFVILDQDGPVVTLTMNAPATRNALSHPEQCDDFVQVLERINQDARVSVLVLTGAGSAFCAGGNVKDMRTRTGLMAGTPAEVGERYRGSLQRLARTLYGLDVPVIAAVNGPAMGAGLDLACMCDLRIASDKARFAETFVKLGLISGIGGAWFLPRAIGQARAAEMAYSGRVIDAESALAYGLVSEIVPDSQLLERARALACEIAANSGVALRYTKRLLRLSERTDLGPALEAAAALQVIAHQTDAHHQAVGRYLEEQNARKATRQ